MKKFISILILTVTIAMIVSGCNMGIGLGNFNFKKVHILTRSGDGFCVDVDRWYENSTGIEIRTTYYGSIYLSEGTYILIESDCPICSRVERR